jgi:hypothetical protein
VNVPITKVVNPDFLVTVQARLDQYGEESEKANATKSRYMPLRPTVPQLALPGTNPGPFSNVLV